MKLVTFGSQFATEIGVVDGDSVVSLSKADPSLPHDMIGLIARWDALKGRVADLVETAKTRTPLKDVQLRQPILRPGKILAIGLNYADHVRETKAEMPLQQIWFCKHVTAANGPYDPIDIPKASEQVDYEAELVAVIGKRGKNIAKADALSHVFGYCCGNDVSVRDWQKRTPQWMLGKSFDTHAPFGPWITSADAVPDPHGLDIACYVNGKRRQNSNTRELIFRIEDQIALVSQAMTLEPGDLIYTGTPSGVAMAMTPPPWLKAGDHVKVEIAGLGALENTVRNEA